MSLTKVKGMIPLIGIALLIYLLIGIGPEKIAGAFLRINPVYILPALFFVVPYLLLQTYKWMYIIGKQGMKPGFPYLFKIYMIGTFWSVLTPGRIGTIARVKYLAKRTKRNIGECTSGIIIDRILDVLSLFVLCMAGVFLLIGHLSGAILAWIAVLFTVFLGGTVFLLKKDMNRGLAGMVYRFAVPKKLKSEAKQTFNSFYENMPRRRDLVVPLAVDVLGWLSMYTSCYFVALALGIDIPFIILVTLYPVATIAGLIPVTVGGFGTREAMLVALLAPFGVVAESVVVLSVLSFFFASILPAAAGAVLVFLCKE